MNQNRSLFFILLIFAVGAIAFLGYRSFTVPRSDVSGIPCIIPGVRIPEELHIHPTLRLIVEGDAVAIPPTLGLDFFGCERALHTHDSSGEIHIEPNYPQDFTLGQFFLMWGHDFSKSSVLGNKADELHEIVMFVDGEENTEYERLILRDTQDILIEYRAQTGHTHNEEEI